MIGLNLILISGGVATIILPTLLYYTWRSVLTKRVSASDNTAVLFFPDSLNESYQTLSNIIKDARSSLDVCVYTITNQKLVRILINAHSEGVVVRVITDQEQETICGGQIWRLRQSGIQVRMNSSTYLMHHKFCVIDQSCLINGSLNWTAQGIECNEENVIITSDSITVKRFLDQFNKLWDCYDPQHIVCIVFVAVFMAIEAEQYFSDDAVYNATKIVIISSSNDQSEVALFPDSVQGAITCISYSGLCFLCHFQLFSLEKELYKPKRWKLNFIVVSSMLIAYGIYNIVAFAGYLHFGSSTKEDVMTNYPSDGILVTIARIALFFTLLFSYPVLFHPTRAVINEIVHYVYQIFKQRDNADCTIQTSDSDEDTLLSTSNNMFNRKERNMLYKREMKPSNLIWVCESWILFSLAFLPASFIPSVGYVWNFVGAIGGTLILYIFPPLFFLRLRYFSAVRAASRTQNPAHSVWSYYRNITVWKDLVALAIILLGVFVLVAGNYVAVEDIVHGHGESFSSCLEYNCLKSTPTSNETINH